ncbi:MAG: class I SAM-dependent methyltransferase [Cyclobacteriaceae bacterium]|nr:class I SAM-dependent methyltransferase [Cyclobacteriaceae bacterium]
MSLINYFQSENLIELGTSIGLNTLYLSKGMHVKHLATFEGNPDLAGLALTHFKAFSKDGIQLVAGDIGYTLPEYLEKADPVDFAFLDAHHTAEATLRYLAMLMPRLTERSVIVIDDIYWSAGMTQAWKRITEDHHEYLYLDLLKMGVMIRDKNAPQGYYVLSY